MVLKAGMKYILTMGYTGLDWLNLYEIFKEEEQELVGIICAFNPQLRLLKRARWLEAWAANIFLPAKQSRQQNKSQKNERF